MIKNDQNILPDQAWFWSKRWQKLEHKAQVDLEAGRVVEFSSLSKALAALDSMDTDEETKN